MILVHTLGRFGGPKLQAAQSGARSPSLGQQTGLWAPFVSGAVLKAYRGQRAATLASRHSPVMQQSSLQPRFRREAHSLAPVAPPWEVIALPAHPSSAASEPPGLLHLSQPALTEAKQAHAPLRLEADAGAFSAMAAIDFSDRRIQEW
jgi:hypothetical protein